MPYLIETCGEYSDIQRTVYYDWIPVSGKLPSTIEDAADLAMKEAGPNLSTKEYRCTEFDVARGTCRDATRDLLEAIERTPDPYEHIGTLQIILHSGGRFGLERIYDMRITS